MDPNSLQCPDYNEELYRTGRELLVNDQVNHKQAAERLADMWRVINATDKARWKVQAGDAAQEAEARVRDAEEKRKDELKKNPTKYLPIPQRGIPAQRPVIPFASAMRELKKGDYVPLWYYTNHGLEDAYKAFGLVDDNALMLSRKADGTTSLVPASSVEEKRGLVEDQDLLWEDFCVAMLRMTDAMRHAEWPADRIHMMTLFWTNIMAHPLRSSDNLCGKKTLLLYQAEQRKLWHQAMRTPGAGYSIAIINEELLRSTRDRVYWSDRDIKDGERESGVNNPSFEVKQLSLTKSRHSLAPPTTKHLSFPRFSSRVSSLRCIFPAVIFLVAVSCRITTSPSCAHDCLCQTFSSLNKGEVHGHSISGYHVEVVSPRFRGPTAGVAPSLRPVVDPGHRKIIETVHGIVRTSRIFHGAVEKLHSTCAACWGHQVHDCKQIMRDGQYPTAAKRILGSLCFAQWHKALCQQARCGSRAHDKNHLCSWYGQAVHGAQSADDR